MKRFDFESSEFCKVLFEKAKDNEIKEASTYLDAIGVKRNTIICTEGRRYSQLHVSRDMFSGAVCLYGHRIKKNGKFSEEKTKIWNYFNIEGDQ